MSKIGYAIQGLILIVIFGFLAKIMSGMFSTVIASFGAEVQFIIKIIVPFTAILLILGIAWTLVD